LGFDFEADKKQNLVNGLNKGIGWFGMNYKAILQAIFAIEEVDFPPT